MSDPTNTRYRTISDRTESFHKDRGSKFYGFACPVSSQEQVDSHLNALKEEYPDATHHCYAFRLGADGSDYRYSDDGEPSNSAVSPIYRQLLSHDLTNTLVVVVRYYGGKKLGVPGLIDAYGTAAHESLKMAHVVERSLTRRYSIRTPLNKEYLIYQLAAQHRLGQPEPDEKSPNLFHFEAELDRWQEITNLLQNLKNFELIIS